MYATNSLVSEPVTADQDILLRGHHNDWQHLGIYFITVAALNVPGIWLCSLISFRPVFCVAFLYTIL